ncbi:MAG: nickel pincer cofactor biosynthesis protein LarC [Planctomycetes bacterium]|nr:nickel pincer cofactor biosynthesis protein LarC [Planctomycetota bacterium]
MTARPVLYLDCFSGIAGDMLIGALLDLGGPTLADLDRDLAGLSIRGYRLSAERVQRGAVSAVKFRVEISPDQPERDHREIQELLARSRLEPEVARRAAAVFRRIAEAESAVHGEDASHVHFHEIGAVDSIVDIAGACALFARLGWPDVRSSALPLGGGKVETRHGLLPVPAPATAYLVRGLAVAPSIETFEQTTPTGAALVAEFARSPGGPLPRMTVGAVGHGAGDRDAGRLPNVLRAWLGEEPAPAEMLWVVEAQVDDLAGELSAALADALFAAGARDVWLAPVQMKKGRPGILASCLADAGRLDAVTDAFFSSSTTFGLRRYPVERLELDREHVPVQTPHGEVRVKIGVWRGKVVTASPEYEDCAERARTAGVPIRVVYRAAEVAWEAQRRASQG